MSLPDPFRVQAEVVLRQPPPEDEEDDDEDGAETDVPQIVSDQVAQAYYPAAVMAADHARSRSQAAYAIASAVAAAIITAGLFSDIEDRAAVVQISGALALGAWLYAAYRFMKAVSERKPDPEKAESREVLEHHDSALAFVDDVLSDSAKERKAVEDHQEVAMSSVMIALILTFATIVGLLLDAPGDPSKQGTFTLFQPGQATVDDACEKTVTRVEGTVDPSKLSDEFVPVEMAAGACRDQAVTLRLRKKHIAAVTLAD